MAPPADLVLQHGRVTIIYRRHAPDCASAHAEMPEYFETLFFTLDASRARRIHAVLVARLEAERTSAPRQFGIVHDPTCTACTLIVGSLPTILLIETPMPHWAIAAARGAEIDRFYPDGYRNRHQDERHRQAAEWLRGALSAADAAFIIFDAPRGRSG